MFCTCTRSCARANDAKIVRSRDAQCNTKELLQGNSSEIKVTIDFCSNFVH